MPNVEITVPVKETIVDNNQVLKDSEEVAQRLFYNIWEEMTDRYGKKNLVFPKQVVFLNGAPGAGKGTNTLAIMRELEIPSQPIEVSSLLTDPECEKIKSQGLLIDDEIVISKVVKELLKPEHSRGIIIDGYPRTLVQAYFLKFLIYKLHEIENERETVFRLINFSVSRQTSIDRQLARGRAAMEQNKVATQEGGEEIPVRATDMSIEGAERRYLIYEESVGRCIALLKDDLDFYEIKTDGTFEEVKNRIRETLSR